MKKNLKWIAWIVATIAVVPWILFVFTARSSGSSDSKFQAASQCLSLLPFKLGSYLRAAFYSNVCPDTDREIAIGFMTLFSHRDTHIGKNVYIGSQCNIGSCIIGKDCLLGSGVHVLSGKGQHNFSDINTPIRAQGGIYTKVTIGEDCWIGNQSIIMANVGNHCIIAAGSVIARDIPSYAIAAGNPATIVRMRTQHST